MLDFQKVGNRHGVTASPLGRGHRYLSCSGGKSERGSKMTGGQKLPDANFRALNYFVSVDDLFRGT